MAKWLRPRCAVCKGNRIRDEHCSFRSYKGRPLLLCSLACTLEFRDREQKADAAAQMQVAPGGV